MASFSKFRLISGWVKEFFLFLFFFVQLPAGFFWNFGPYRGRRQTVLIVTDVLCTPLLYFRLRHALIQAGFSVIVINAANPFRSMTSQARILAKKLEQHNVRDAILVGHGSGSLAAVALADAGRQRIKHLISLGTPFHGSRLFLSFRLIPALRDMTAGSEFLLINRINALLFPSFTPFCPWQDEWIIPFNLAHFGQGRDMIFDQVGHYNLVLGGENLETILEFINETYPVLKETPASPAPERKIEKPVSKKPAGKKKAAKKSRKK